MRRLCCFALLLFLTSLGQPARGQADAPDPRALFEQAIATARGIQTFSYEVTAFLEGGGGTQLSAGQVVMERLPSPADTLNRNAFLASVPMRFRADLDAAASFTDKTGAQAHAYDGTTYLMRYAPDKVVLELPVDESAPLPSSAFVLHQVLLLEFHNPDRLQRYLAHDFTYHGINEVHGVPCHVIEVGDDWRYWYIGVADHLVRRRDQTGVYSEVRNLRVNEPLPEGAFTLKVPEGYQYQLAY